MSKTTHDDMDALIAKHASRDDLTPADVLQLTLARRLNNCSDATLAKALGGADEPALNFWGQR